MPAVHNVKSRARDFHAGRSNGRSRPARFARSWFVLIALAAVTTYLTATVEVRFGTVPVANEAPTENSPGRSVSRVSEAAAKRTDTAEASMTRSLCQFKRA
jgi:hypothetical protein